MSAYLLAIAPAVHSIISKAIEPGSNQFSRGPLPIFFASALALGALLATTVSRAPRSVADDAKFVAALDTHYQEAVKSNDAVTMARILADDFVLVTGSGKSYTKADLIAEARSGNWVFEHNEELEQKVRVWGDTAVVTAKLWEKGTNDGKPFDRTIWFSDTYVRSAAGWRYVFGQSSLPLPNSPE